MPLEEKTDFTQKLEQHQTPQGQGGMGSEKTTEQCLQNSEGEKCVPTEILYPAQLSSKCADRMDVFSNPHNLKSLFGYFHTPVVGGTCSV